MAVLHISSRLNGIGLRIATCRRGLVSGSRKEKHERFAAEYVIDLNATQAAIRTGYSEKTAGQIGFELLKKPEIQEAISAAMKARSEHRDYG